MGRYSGDFTGIRSMSGRVEEEKALSFPSEFIKFSLRWEKGSLVNTKFFLCSRVVLPEILGSLSRINRTSAEFSRKRDAEQSNG